MMDVSTFAAEIMRRAEGQPLEAIEVTGWAGGRSIPNPSPDLKPGLYRHPAASAEVMVLLAYEWPQPYPTTPKCHDITAWTEDWVIVTEEYDGAMGLAAHPRNPGQ